MELPDGVCRVCFWADVAMMQSFVAEAVCTDRALTLPAIVSL